VNLQQVADEDTDPIERMGIMSKVAKNIASLTNASIAQKKFKAEVKAKAAEVAEKAAKLARQGGLSADTVAEIRRSILGIAT
jgi:chorismate mutase